MENFGIRFLNSTVQAKIEAHDKKRSPPASGGKSAKKAEPVPRHIDMARTVPVYEHRSKALLGFLFVLAGHDLAAAVTHSDAPSLTACLAIFVAAWLVTDLYSGVLHIVLDNEKVLEMELPLLWRGAFEFQWHHEIPKDISSKSFSNVVGDIVPLIIAHYVFLMGIRYAGLHNPYIGVATFFKFMFAIQGQWCHRMSHTDPKYVPRWSRMVARAGFFMGRDEHQKHHMVYDESFCIVSGKCNPALNWFIKNCVGLDSTAFWVAAFVALTAVDVYAVGMAASYLMN